MIMIIVKKMLNLIKKIHIMIYINESIGNMIPQWSCSLFSYFVEANIGNMVSRTINNIIYFKLLLNIKEFLQISWFVDSIHKWNENENKL